MLSKRGVLNEPKNVAIYLVRRFLETGVASDHKPYGMVGLKIEELGHGFSSRKAFPMPLLDSFPGRFEIEKGEPVRTASQTRASSFGLTILPSFL